MQAIFQPLQGLFDAIVYGATDPTFTTNYKVYKIYYIFSFFLILTNNFKQRIFMRIVEKTKYTKIETSVNKAELDFDYSYSSTSNYNIIN